MVSISVGQSDRESDVPIIMVTARSDTHDVVGGLESGADDYLTKPFAPKRTIRTYPCFAQTHASFRHRQHSSYFQ